MSLHGPSGGGCHLTISCPGADGVGTGAYTVAALFKPNDFQASTMWRGYQANDFSFRGLYVDGDMWCPDQQADTNIPSFASSPQWYWMVVSKGASDEAPRAHWAAHASSGALSWTHLTAFSTQTNRSAINRFTIGDEFGTEFRGNLAVLTAFETLKSDAEIEALFLHDSARILAASPGFFIHLPEWNDVNLPIDLAGGGTTSIMTGSWDASTDPDGYNFSLALPGQTGKPKVWNGSDWVAHQAKVYNGSTWVNSSMSGYNGTDWVESK